MVRCESSSEYTWTLLSTEIYYGNWSRRHWVKQEWKWELKCPGYCLEPSAAFDFLKSNCQPEGWFGSKTGVVTREVQLKDVKNRHLTSEQIAVLRACHSCDESFGGRPCDGRKHFLPCVEKSGVVRNLTDLIDEVWAAGPPLEEECDSWVDKCDCAVSVSFGFLPSWRGMIKPLGGGSSRRDRSNEELKGKRVIARGGEENKLW